MAKNLYFYSLYIILYSFIYVYLSTHWYIYILIWFYNDLFGAYLKTGNKPAFIYLDLFDKLAKTGKKKGLTLSHESRYERFRPR